MKLLKYSPEGELAGWVAEWETYRTLMLESIASLKKTGETEGKDGYVLYAVNTGEFNGSMYSVVLICSNRQSLPKQMESILVERYSQQNYDLGGSGWGNEEAQFYWNKLRTTEFYVWSVLPRALSNAKTIKNANLAPLSACL